jgi:hypothetical protein
MWTLVGSVRWLGRRCSRVVQDAKLLYDYFRKYPTVLSRAAGFGLQFAVYQDVFTLAKLVLHTFRNLTPANEVVPVDILLRFPLAIAVDIFGGQANLGTSVTIVQGLEVYVAAQVADELYVVIKRVHDR